MKLVTKDHLENWANTTFSKAMLPYLISRLIRATTPISTKVNLPSGSATFIGGWDGVVSCESETSYVPKGISLWEFGTRLDCKGQADENYDKRTYNSLGFNSMDSTFIFVTVRLWTKKEEWVTLKKAERRWENIIVYDAIDLEQWLDIALSVSRWFSAQDGVGSYPFDGMMTADEFWEEWSIGPNGLLLTPECVVAGREVQKDILLTTLQGEPTIKGIKASTKNEAVAFVIAAAKAFQSEESSRFFSKTLIVDTEANYRGIRIKTITALNLIPRFDDAQPLYAAVSKGHHVLVPLGADDNFNQDTIILPTIDRDGQIQSLIESGITREDAEKYSRESGRNITILKKLLGFPYYKAKWLAEENIREIIPVLLIGRWNETYEGDIEVIEKLSAKKYEDYLVTLNKWKNIEESPIIQIGETWRLTSPLDLWTNIYSYLTSKDLEDTQQSFESVFKDGNPVIAPRDKKDFAAYFNKKRKYSGWLREGLTQSLILIGRLNEMKIADMSNPQGWVDNIISKLLINASGSLWISLNYELPLIAEASPDSFLQAVKKSLEKDQPEIMEMFREEDGFLDKVSHHTGLLWALESLAWLPDYLSDASMALLTLARFDPGGRLSNRPLNCLLEIFKPWHYQTLADYDERMDVLKFITRKEKESGWMFLIQLLPGYHDSALATHKMRWRMFDKDTNLTYTYQEIWDTHTTIVETLIGLFDNDEDKFSQIAGQSTNVELVPADRNRILEWAERIYPNVRHNKYSAWATIRVKLNHHRSHPDADWALPETELLKLEALYNKLQPIDIVNKHIWLFNDTWPVFPEVDTNGDEEFSKMRDREQYRLDEARKDAVAVFLKELGLDETIELRKKMKGSGIFGDSLAKVITNQNEVVKVCDCLYDDVKLIGFVQCFIYRKSVTENFEWIKALFKQLRDREFSFKALSNFLIPLTQNKDLWSYIATLDEQIKLLYWQNMRPNCFHITSEERMIGIEMLLKHKRFFSAIDIAAHFVEEIPNSLLSEILLKAGTEAASEHRNFNAYQIQRILDSLEKQADVEKSTVINLEWLYLSILDSYKKGSAKVLEEELANSPEFFIEVLKWVYLPEDRSLMEKEREGLSDLVIENRAKHAYRLLRSWRKIPGMNKDFIIDGIKLKEWIANVRKQAVSVGRLNVADSEIGEILAQYPENIPTWPEETIFEIIEEINTDRIKSGYSSAMYNKRGMSSRGAFDGGDIERGKAEYFEKLQSKFKNRYPNVADIFKYLKEGYLIEANRQDEGAERDKLEY